MQEGNGILDDLFKDKSRTVVFSDKTPDVGTGNKRKRRGGELPNPKFIEIHAAIAQVLHTSGAGTFFAAVADKVGEKGVGARSWAEMERKLELHSLTTALENALG